MNIGKGLYELIVGLLILALIAGALIVGIIWFAVGYHSDTSIKSKTPIKYEIELVTDGKTVDTLYVYKQPKNND